MDSLALTNLEEKVTLRQVQYACSTRLTPQKHRCGARSAIDAESLKILVNFVCASSENRQMSYKQIL